MADKKYRSRKIYFAWIDDCYSASFKEDIFLNQALKESAMLIRSILPVDNA